MKENRLSTDGRDHLKRFQRRTSDLAKDLFRLLSSCFWNWGHVLRGAGEGLGRDSFLRGLWRDVVNKV
jgi:hypothetical protein